jgi:hypothetical protein
LGWENRFIDDEASLNPETLTPEDLEFLQLLSILLWNVRPGFLKRISKQDEYNLDILGDDPSRKIERVDQLVRSLAQSIIAVFTPGVIIEIGDIFDNTCLSCAVGQHCLEHKNDDLAVVLQLGNFIEGKNLPTPNGDTLEQPRGDKTIKVESAIVRAFLYDRTDSVLLDSLKPEENMFLSPLLSLSLRSILMTQKRARK